MKTLELIDKLVESIAPRAIIRPDKIYIDRLYDIEFIIGNIKCGIDGNTVISMINGVGTEIKSITEKTKP